MTAIQGGGNASARSGSRDPPTLALRASEGSSPPKRIARRWKRGLGLSHGLHWRGEPPWWSAERRAPSVFFSENGKNSEGAAVPRKHGFMDYAPTGAPPPSIFSAAWVAGENRRGKVAVKVGPSRSPRNPAERP